MDAIVEVLYRMAIEQGGLTYWLFDQDMARDYSDCSRYCEEQEAALLKALNGEDLGLFKKYVMNMEEKYWAESKMLFNRALSIGIALGSLGR